MVRCRNYSVENLQCRYNYTPHPMINIKDLIPHCDGHADFSKCCWYHIGKLTPFVSDIELRQYRARFKAQVKEERWENMSQG